MEQGTRLNDTYVVMEQLGRGGGGVVYKAYHERLQTYVVVKQVREKVKGILEGRGEADILKKLKHSNLPQVYDFLEIDGEIYTVMDYIPGESLDKAVQKHGPFDSRKVYQWALQLGDALSCLHSQKPAIIHSDIKPANVMLTPEGNVSLIDFNISLAFNDGWRMSAGISGGYSPPEQHPDFKTYLKRIGIREEDKQETVLEEAGAAWETAVLEAAGAGETVLEGAGQDLAVLEEAMEAETAETVLEGAAWETAVLEEDVPDTALLEKKAVSGRKKQAEGSRAAGTENFIAGLAGRGVDERSDIYSLGATLYHLLTGIKPSEDYGKIRSLGSLGLNIGQGFCVIIEKMMELDPKRRYQNGQELLHALKHVYELDKEFIAYRRRCRRQRALAAVVCGAGIALAGLGWNTLKQERSAAYNRSVEQAGVLMDEARYEQAGQAIEEAVSLVPGRIEAYEKEALRLYRMGDYEEVIRYTRDVINHPAYEISGKEEEKLLGNLFYILGSAYFEEEDYGNAMDCFQNALERNRENSLCFRDYAITLAKTGNTERAEEALEAAAKLGLGEDSIYMVQGEIAYAKGEDNLAAERLEASIRSAQSEELLRRATLLCTQAYQRMGTDYLDREIELLERSENLFGTGVSLHLSQQLADAYARKAGCRNEHSGEYYKKALDKFEELYEKGYKTRQTMENLAILYQQTERLGEAKDVLLQMAEQYPEDYRTYKRLAFLEADIQQQKENAERDYKAMDENWKKAEELYEKQAQTGDTEMDMLRTMGRELEEGGWFRRD